MKRRYLMTGMIPAAMAAQDSLVPCSIPIGHSRCKPRNNECPVCGTMAPAYKNTRFMKFKPCPGERSGELTAIVCADEVPIQSENLIRCSHCNTAFFQDGE